MALACYFWLNLFLIFSWTLVSSKFVLCGVLPVILHSRKKTRPKTRSGCGSYGPLIRWVCAVLNGTILSCRDQTAPFWTGCWGKRGLSCWAPCLVSSWVVGGLRCSRHGAEEAGAVRTSQGWRLHGPGLLFLA